MSESVVFTMFALFMSSCVGLVLSVVASMKRGF